MILYLEIIYIKFLQSFRGWHPILIILNRAVTFHAIIINLPLDTCDILSWNTLRCDDILCCLIKGLILLMTYFTPLFWIWWSLIILYAKIVNIRWVRFFLHTILQKDIRTFRPIDIEILLVEDYSKHIFH